MAGTKQPLKPNFGEQVAQFFATTQFASERYYRRMAQRAARDIAKDLKLAPTQKLVVQAILVDPLRRAVNWGKNHPNEP